MQKPTWFPQNSASSVQSVAVKAAEKKKKAQGFTSKTSAPDPIIFFPTPQTSAYSLRTISPQPLAAVAHILAFPMSAASARAASFALLRVTLAVAFLLDDIAV